jgi:hypothetical protein
MGSWIILTPAIHGKSGSYNHPLLCCTFYITRKRAGKSQRLQPSWYVIQMEKKKGWQNIYEKRSLVRLRKRYDSIIKVTLR